MNKIEDNKTGKDRDKRNIRVALGLSGGVDSAVAAALLQEEGYDLTAFYLQCWDFDLPGCGGDTDRNDAIHVSTELGIKFNHLDFIEEYRERVMDYFYKEYREGRTPNPDVLCNSEIKYGIFLDWAIEQGFDYIATGHYARRMMSNGCIQLLSGVDRSKDQSYFLYRLNQYQLQHALFPLGTMLKHDVREKAKELGLRIHNKPGSMGICFIGKIDLKEFLEEEIQPKEGDVLDLSGKRIGRHSGVWFYTIGQRHGFEITEYQGMPLYVVDKNVNRNELIVGSKENAFKSYFNVGEVHWICEEPKMPLEANVRVRNLGQFYNAKISPVDTGSLRVSAENDIFGIAPGQSAVFYDGPLVLGGGIILS